MEPSSWVATPLARPVAAFAKWNRAYGVDANVQLSANQRFSSFIARTDTPGATGSDYSGRAFYNFTNNLWQLSGGYSQVGERFNPEVGFLPRRGYRRPEFRAFFQPQPKNIKWIRRIAPHYSYGSFWGFDRELQSSSMHVHPFEIQPAQGGRFGWFFDRTQDNPTVPFTVYNRDVRRVSIPAGEYTWYQHAFEYIHDPARASPAACGPASATSTTGTSIRSKSTAITASARE